MQITSERLRQLLALLCFLVAVLAVGAIGAFFTPGAWYASLNKPTWNPPNWIFGPVWTALYIMIAVSGWLVWCCGAVAGRSLALSVYCVQLVLNAAWSWLFFGLQRPDLAFIEIVMLWVAILLTVATFRRLSNLAAVLLIPYFLWVTFAAFLNWNLWRLNV